MLGTTSGAALRSADRGRPNTTLVRFTFETKPKFLSDRLQESLGGASWLKRKNAKALKRLRTILEDGHGRGKKPTISGGPRKPASAYTFSRPANQ